MSEDFINISRSLDTLTLAQVAEKINVKDIETAKKWLQEKRIKIHRFLNNSFVYQIEVDSQIDKPFVQQLRNKYPDKWKDRYRDVVKDLSVYNLTITLLEDDISPIPRVKSSRINKKDEERYKKTIRMKKLTLPKNAHKGLKIFCKTCRVDNPRCRHYSRQVYRVRVHIPGNSNSIKTKVLDATNYSSAIIECIDFEKELKSN